MKSLGRIREILFDLQAFVSRLARKWFFWLFLGADLAALVAQYIYPQFRLPSSAYIVFALVGFFLSAFAVYRDERALNRTLAPRPQRSSLILSLTEGNEYTYSIHDPYKTPKAQFAIEQAQRDKQTRTEWQDGKFLIDGKVYYQLPGASIVVNLRIENDGDVPMDIISLRTGLIDDPAPAIPVFGSEPQIDGQYVIFPLQMVPTMVVGVQIELTTGPHIYRTPAEFASEFRSVKQSFLVPIRLDAVDPDGKKTSSKLTAQIMSRPLTDLYVAQWRAYQQVQFLRLAGVPVLD